MRIFSPPLQSLTREMPSHKFLEKRKQKIRRKNRAMQTKGLRTISATKRNVSKCTVFHKMKIPAQFFSVNLKPPREQNRIKKPRPSRLVKTRKGAVASALKNLFCYRFCSLIGRRGLSGRGGRESFCGESGGKGRASF